MYVIQIGVNSAEQWASGTGLETPALLQQWFSTGFPSRPRFYMWQSGKAPKYLIIDRIKHLFTLFLILELSSVNTNCLFEPEKYFLV